MLVQSNTSFSKTLRLINEPSYPYSGDGETYTGPPVTPFLKYRINRTRGYKQYELTNHLGNVMVTLSDRKVGIKNTAETHYTSYTADVYTAQEYFAFGSPIFERKFSGGDGYRYGFGGHEKDDEVKGKGNHICFADYGYDPRLGRRWRLDPLAYRFAGHTPYNYCFNNPIIVKDPDGKTGIATIEGDKVVVKQNYFFYGSAITKEKAESIAYNMQEAWNAANGEIEIGGKRYEVVFEIQGYSISGPEEAVKMLKTASFEDNFIAVGSDTRKASNGDFVNTSFMVGNSGWFNLAQDNATAGTTFFHEPIHGLGMDGHPDVTNGSVTNPANATDRDGNIAIRIPFGSLINGVPIDPTKRKVMQSDIDMLNLPALLKGKNTAEIGKVRDNIAIMNEDGTAFDFVPKIDL